MSGMPTIFLSTWRRLRAWNRLFRRAECGLVRSFGHSLFFGRAAPSFKVKRSFGASVAWISEQMWARNFFGGIIVFEEPRF